VGTVSVTSLTHCQCRHALFACSEDALNEIRILASIKHRNIVRYCDAFVQRDNLYIVMEFAEHGDISRQVRGARWHLRLDSPAAAVARHLNPRA
jgi:serine/threonine protein kinase